MAKPLLIKAIDYVKSGKALDIGAGNGEDSKFLVEKGFDVTAVEKKAGLKIGGATVCNADIRDFEFEKYDLINCCFVLHFLGDKARGLLKSIQESTNINGVNVIITFLDEGEFERENKGFFKSNELKDSYYGWEVLVYGEKEVVTKEKNSDGSYKKQKAAFLLAKKPAL